ncbi:MAG: hypothetical protein ACRCX8_10205 [Sarcina sp.]
MAIQKKPRNYRIGLRRCNIKDKDMLLKLENDSKAFRVKLEGKEFQVEKTPNNRDFKNDYLRSEYEYYIINRLEGKKKTKQGKVDKHVIPIGLLVIERIEDENIIEIEITDLFISKEFRRKEFGHKTLDVLKRIILKDYKEDDRRIEYVYDIPELKSNETQYMGMENFINVYGFRNWSDDDLYRLAIKEEIEEE